MSDNERRELEIAFVEFKATVTEWMSGTTEYRKSLCSKIDSIIDRMNKLPCDKRSGFYDAVNRQLGIMWVIIGGVVVKILSDWIGK